MEDVKIMRDIEKIGRTLSLIYGKRFESLDLARGQYVYLIYVYENPGQSQLDMVNALNVDKTTVTKALKKMTTSGLIFRQRDPEDGRISRVYPTEKGREVYRELNGQEQLMASEFLKSLTERERYELEGMLGKIIKEMEGAWQTSRSYLSPAMVKPVTDPKEIPFLKDEKWDDWGWVYVCEYRERPVGYIRYLDQHPLRETQTRWDPQAAALYVADLMVMEAYRNRGYGYQLLKIMEPLAKERGFTVMRLMVEEQNIPMLKLVNALEFRFVGEISPDGESHFCFEKDVN